VDAESGRRRMVRWLPALALALVVAVACGSPDTDDLATAAAGAITRSSSSPAAAATPATPPAPPSSAAPTSVNRTTTFGTSVSGRPLTVTEIGNPASFNRILIVGCIHGNEPAGIAVADALAKAPPPVDADLWLVTVLNPDGVSANTRQNANGVDLNRNFPFEWQPNGKRGAVEYGGPSALSEPESQAAATLIRSIRPTTAIWFHQHLAVVDNSQGPAALEARFAAMVGLPLAKLTDYPGSAVGWEDTTFGPTAFVVELPAGTLDGPSVSRYVAAIRAIPQP
jgi:murein peptide amidase A